MLEFAVGMWALRRPYLVLDKQVSVQRLLCKSPFFFLFFTLNPQLTLTVMSTEAVANTFTLRFPSAEAPFVDITPFASPLPFADDPPPLPPPPPPPPPPPIVALPHAIELTK
jgi:hypothetical protein